MGIKRCRPISFIQPVPSQPYVQLGNDQLQAVYELTKHFNRQPFVQHLLYTVTRNIQAVAYTAAVLFYIPP